MRPIKVDELSRIEQKRIEHCIKPLTAYMDSRAMLQVYDRYLAGERI